jgi:hypothetical protein
VIEPRFLVHTEWFDHALRKFANLPNADELLAKEFYRIACYADLIPCASGNNPLRIYQTAEFLRHDGQVLQFLIYFALRPDNTVELQHIESIDADMSAGTP